MINNSINIDSSDFKKIKTSNGITTIRISFFQRIPFNGILVQYHIDGKLSKKETYKEGKLDGVVEHYYDNGQLMSREIYKGGESRHGLHEVYFNNGNLHLKSNYSNGKPLGTTEQYYEDGQLEVKGISHNNGDYKYEFYNENGHLTQIRTKIDGISNQEHFEENV